MTTARPLKASALRSISVVTIAVVVLNVSTYTFTVVAARLLGPAEFGAVAALMGLLLVLNVVGLGLQTTGARRISQASAAERPQLQRQILAVANRAAPLLGLLCLAGTPLMVHAFRLDHWATAAMVVAAVIFQTMLFGQAGVLQGRRRWAPLAALYAVNGLGRLLCGVAAMLVRHDALAAMVGTAIGSLLPVLLGWWLLRGDRSPGSPTPPLRGAVTELAHNSHALLAFLALTNIDIIVARSTLIDHRAGLYAGGLILVKAVLFLPQFVLVLVFPSLAAGGKERSESHRRGLLLVGGLGVVSIAGAALLPALAMVFVGGSQYSSIESRLWQFAILGTALSLLQLLVYDVVARQDHAAVAVLWTGVVAIAVAGLTVTSVGGLLHWVLTVDILATLILGALSFRPRRVPQRT